MFVLVACVGLAAGVAVAVAVAVACAFDAFVPWSVEFTHANISRQSKPMIAVHGYHRLSIVCPHLGSGLAVNCVGDENAGHEVRQWLRTNSRRRAFRSQSGKLSIGQKAAAFVMDLALKR